MAIVESPMTAEQLLALPRNGIDRELIRGGLRERPQTVRNWIHSGIGACVAAELIRCLDESPEPRGRVVAGEAGFRLGSNPDTVVGDDVAYPSPEHVQTRSPSALFEGSPVLAVEVLCPSDKQEEIDAKVVL
jgi:hypothetical protein